MTPDQQVIGRVADMAAFVDQPRAPAAMSYIRNATIGGDTAYVYVTRRTYDRADDTVTLTCMGDPSTRSTTRATTRTDPFPERS